ncbi:unnamed protein product [Phaeothamnion confervicola]
MGGFSGSMTNFFLGIALSGNSGLRASVPLFLASIMSLTSDSINISSDMSWLSTPTFAVCMGIFMAVEIILDKIPGIDHVLHVVMSVIHPIAGAVASIAPDYGGGWYARVPVLAFGSALALIIFLGRALLRVMSSGGTCGACNPFVSCFEDVLVFILVPVCILVAFFSVSRMRVFLSCFYLFGRK